LFNVLIDDNTKSPKQGLTANLDKDMPNPKNRGGSLTARNYFNEPNLDYIPSLLPLVDLGT